MDLKQRILCVFVIIVRCDVEVSSQEEIPLCSSGNNTVQSCCPCYKNDPCNQTCPAEYLTVHMPGKCQSAPVGTTNRVAGDEQVTTVCFLSCPEHDFYNNITQECRKCAWPDAADCIRCRYEINGTCYEACPGHTTTSKIVSNDSTIYCEEAKQQNEEQAIPLGAIIGGVLGGATVLASLIATVVCLIRKRKKSEQLVNNPSKENRELEPYTTVIFSRADKKSEESSSASNNQPGDNGSAFDSSKQRISLSDTNMKTDHLNETLEADKKSEESSSACNNQPGDNGSEFDSSKQRISPSDTNMKTNNLNETLGDYENVFKSDIPVGRKANVC